MPVHRPLCFVIAAFVPVWLAVAPPSEASATGLPAETEMEIIPAQPRRPQVPGRLLVTVLLAGLAVVGYRALRAPRCSSCRTALQKLGEEAATAHRTPIEKTEARLRSVDHQVWACQQGHEIRKVRQVRFASDLEACPDCGAKAVKATQVASGPKIRFLTACAHCGYQGSSTMAPRGEPWDGQLPLWAQIALKLASRLLRIPF